MYFIESRQVTEDEFERWRDNNLLMLGESVEYVETECRTLLDPAKVIRRTRNQEKPKE